MDWSLGLGRWLGFGEGEEGRGWDRAVHWLFRVGGQAVWGGAPGQGVERFVSLLTSSSERMGWKTLRTHAPGHSLLTTEL